jgi:phosphatidylglycerophosphate synthase
MSPGHRSVNLPNAITVGRIFLVPLLVVVLMTNPERSCDFGVSRRFSAA